MFAVIIFVLDMKLIITVFLWNVKEFHKNKLENTEKCLMMKLKIF